MGQKASRERKAANAHWVLPTRTPPITDDYTLGKKLGQPGQYGYAQLATEKKTKVARAVKVIAKARFKPDQFEHFRREIEIMKNLSHRNIVKGFDAYEDHANLYLVMELCKGGELFDRIKARERYTEADAAGILRQLCEGLKYMHDKKIAHCDLKPDNFLFATPEEDSCIKIIDFGMSKFTKPMQYMESLCGTSFYMAPEVLRGKYTYHCDMWSIGVVTFIMLFGFPPFHGSEPVIRANIKKGFTPREAPGYGPWFPNAPNLAVSAEAKDFIAKLLDSDPAVRPTAQEALEHPWLSGQASQEPLDKVLSNLTDFTANYKFKQAVLEAMTGSLSDAEVADLKSAFRALDKDGDGTITVAELKEAVDSGNASGPMFEKILKMGDADGDGKLSYNELLMATMQKKLIAKEDRLWNTFNQLDTDRSGKISAEEIKKVLGPREDIAEMIAEIDSDGDGEVDFDEFCRMFIKLDNESTVKALAE